MWRYFELLSARSIEQIARLHREVDEGRNPRDAKVALAQEIVTRFHSAAAAEHALEEFEARFRRGAVPEDIADVAVALGDQALAIPLVLKQAGLVSSTSEAARSIEQGAVRIDGERVSDRALQLRRGIYVIQVGKRRWARVTLS